MSSRLVILAEMIGFVRFCTSRAEMLWRVLRHSSVVGEDRDSAMYHAACNNESLAKAACLGRVRETLHRHSHKKDHTRTGDNSHTCIHGSIACRYTARPR